MKVYSYSEKNFKKSEKTFQKGVDNHKRVCYYVQARSRAQHLRERRTLKTIQKQETQTTVNNLSLAPKGV